MSRAAETVHHGRPKAILVDPLDDDHVHAHRIEFAKRSEEMPSKDFYRRWQDAAELSAFQFGKQRRMHDASNLPPRLALVLQNFGKWNPYVAVPFSAWDVTNPSSPRQLTVAWRDQIDDGIWNPSLGNDNGEIVFIYYKSYDPTGTTQFSMPPGAIGDETTVGEKADIMYGLSIQVLPGHSLNESAGTLTITPSYYMPATIAVKPGSDQGVGQLSESQRGHSRGDSIDVDI